MTVVNLLTINEFNCCSHFPFLAVHEEYGSKDISTQMEAICAINSFLVRCEDTLRNLCSQVFAVFTEGLVNLSKLLHCILFLISCFLILYTCILIV